MTLAHLPLWVGLWEWEINIKVCIHSYISKRRGTLEAETPRVIKNIRPQPLNPAVGLSYKKGVAGFSKHHIFPKTRRGTDSSKHQPKSFI